MGRSRLRGPHNGGRGELHIVENRALRVPHGHRVGIHFRWRDFFVPLRTTGAHDLSLLPFERSGNPRAHHGNCCCASSRQGQVVSQDFQGKVGIRAGFPRIEGDPGIVGVGELHPQVLDLSVGQVFQCDFALNGFAEVVKGLVQCQVRDLKQLFIGREAAQSLDGDGAMGRAILHSNSHGVKSSGGFSGNRPPDLVSSFPLPGFCHSIHLNAGCGGGADILNLRKHGVTAHVTRHAFHRGAQRGHGTNVETAIRRRALDGNLITERRPVGQEKCCNQHQQEELS